MAECKDCTHYLTCRQGNSNPEHCGLFMNYKNTVEVVRCKDCDCWCEEMKVGHANLGNEIAPCSEWSDTEDGHIRYTKATDFCSYGERRDDAENH